MKNGTDGEGVLSGGLDSLVDRFEKFRVQGLGFRDGEGVLSGGLDTFVDRFE